MGDMNGVPVSWIQLCPILTILAFWEVNQRMKHVSLGPTPEVVLLPKPSWFAQIKAKSITQIYQSMIHSMHDLSSICLFFSLYIWPQYLRPNPCMGSILLHTQCFTKMPFFSLSCTFPWGFFLIIFVLILLWERQKQTGKRPCRTPFSTSSPTFTAL